MGQNEMCGVAMVGHHVSRRMWVTQSRIAGWMHSQSGPLDVMLKDAPVLVRFNCGYGAMSFASSNLVKTKGPRGH